VSRTDRGFTLLELLVVISVIAILAAVVTPMVFRNVGDAKVSAARAQLEILELALDAYRLDNNYYPTTEQGLQALVVKPTSPPAPFGWRGPYLKRAVPTDPWGKPFVYRSPARPGGTDTYDLLSLGRGGEPGGDGEDADISLSASAGPGQ
jgi:general secretion pathway protein G